MVPPGWNGPPPHAHPAPPLPTPPALYPPPAPPMNVRHLAARTVGPPRPEAPAPPPRSPTPPGPSFADALRRAQEGAAPAPPPVTFSAHAEQRVQQRAISLTVPEQEAIREAVAHLDAKGARDALLLRPDAAFVVNVPNRTVVTALASGDLTDRVFTGIDSALVL